MNQELERLKGYKRLRIEHLRKSSIYEHYKSYIDNPDFQNTRQILYHIEQGHMDIPECPICGNKLPWHPDNLEYRSFCSRKCTAKGTINQREQTTQEKYGKKYFSQTKDWYKKTKATNQKRFGKDHYMQTDEYKEKLNRDHPMRRTEVKAKIQATNMKRYGHTNPLYSESIKNRIKATNIEKYGVLNHMQKHISSEHLKALQSPELLQEWLDIYYVKDLADKFNISTHPLWLRIHKWGLTYSSRRSYLEEEIKNWLMTIYSGEIQQNQKINHNSYEVDFIFPDKKLALEVDGIYWHSELAGKSANYHVLKDKVIESYGYNVIHIWETDWLHSKEITKNLIVNKLGLNTATIGARKLRVVSISEQDYKQFLNENHLNGYAAASIRYGLISTDNEVLAVMSFGKPRFNKTYDYELIRYCVKNFYSVPGGASKLFKEFVKNYNPKTILSYADKRYSTGNLYKQLGFLWINNTRSNYWYFKDASSKPHNRVKFQKHKLPNLLENFDSSLSEWENMKNHGYNRIWDCGNSVWVWTNQ